jgi:hypothetical protein
MLLGLLAGCCTGHQAVQPHPEEVFDVYPEMPAVSVNLLFPYLTTNDWQNSAVLKNKGELIKADERNFARSIQQFAERNGLRDCRNQYGAYSGPLLCSFKGERLQIMTIPWGITNHCVGFVMAPTTLTHMTAEDLKLDAEPLIKTLQVRFPERLKIEYRNFLQ